MKAFFISLCVCALALGGAPLHAQELKTNSPAIQEIRDSLRARIPRLKPLLESGALGVTREQCRLEVRDPAAIPLAERPALTALIAADLRDKKALFQEIARLNNNGSPDWETQFAAKFSERCLDRAPAGWWVKDAAGKWARK
jgi:hypothetical protein